MLFLSINIKNPNLLNIGLDFLYSKKFKSAATKAF